ncbi:SCO family protein [Alcaligenes nematophilus]|uniref:SCO family protein n=3 Tax=Alcaligenes TaxID=507 RepID=A0AAE9KMF4_ALCFA|nr:MULTISPECIES: SCO family protein [Alcaligenes]EKU29149.1 electron transport protein sco1/senc [Alcaligenes sp. HPC1271]ERI34945.1 photosynthetic protein synthase I [Alcaligenes sp. EGD-AK7]MDT8464076.1 SCO family protein [Alcaligenes nematophilus]MDT8470066.1 SCO family protein [Alcaligenes nematophilus]MDT8505595.1 SCO family protein [Alcaligenes nematophilus]
MNASFSRRQLLLAMLATPLVLSACGDKAPKQPAFRNLEGVDMSSADFAKDFSLLDTEGQRRTMADYRGKIVLIFFGFTQCPDVCPTALTRAVDIKEQLGEDGDKLQVLFISIDPERDTPELLRAYMQAFDPSFVALRPTEEELAKTASDFKVFYQKVPTGSSYTMDHSALTYVYDTQGKLQIALRHTQTAEEAVADIRQVLALSK